MDTEEFWKIIERANQTAEGDQEDKLYILVSQLEPYAEKDIIEFERILRAKIIECDYFTIMAILKIVEGYVTDDSYLYFRCWLIGSGKAVYENAIKDPDSVSQVVDFSELLDFEGLLYVATAAFAHKTGREEDDSFPRDLCSADGLDYDFNAPPTKGQVWNEADLSSLLPNLWARKLGR